MNCCAPSENRTYDPEGDMQLLNLYAAAMDQNFRLERDT